MNQPRILFVYQFMSLGGVEIVLQTRLNELARRGIDSRVLFLERYGGESLFDSMANQVSVCTTEPEIEKFMLDFNPDWVLSIDTPAIMPIARRVLPQANFAYEVHTRYSESYSALLDPYLFEGVSGLLVPSESQKQFITFHIASPLPIKVVNNSVSELFFEREEARYAPQRPVVLWVGRLDPLKNWRGFVELAKHIKDRADAEFWLLGGLKSAKAEQDNLFAAVKEAGLIDALRWLPAVKYNDMPRVYRSVGLSGGCLLSTSWGESFGMALLEAMASRCPVIAPDVAGIRDLVKNGETGWLYPPVDVRRASQLVLDSFQNLEARKSVVENGESFARGFTPGRTIDQLLESLDDWSHSTQRLVNRPTTSFNQARIISMLKERVERLTHTVLNSERLFREEVRATKASLSAAEEEIANHEQTISRLSAELTAKRNELDQIKSSFGWRLLSRYGQIKYRYLLPIYRALGLRGHIKSRK